IMLFRHVLRTFKKQWLSITLLGLLLIISGFIYTTMSMSTESIETASTNYFKTHKQEDFYLEMTHVVTSSDQEALSTCNPTLGMMLSELKTQNTSCYTDLLNARIDRLESEYTTVDFALRYYKDHFIEHGEARNRIRVFRDTDAINIPYFKAGEAPSNNEEIAITKVYADHHQLNIGDTITLKTIEYTITGFVIFPDYNLPILDNVYMFDGTNQTLGLLHNQAYDALDAQEYVHISGLFEDDDPGLERTIYDFDFITYMELTENNMRSGAIYTEIEGGQGIGLFLSILIATIGLIIVGIMVSKTLNDEKAVLGVLKALGTRTRAIIYPYTICVFIFAVIALTIGAFLGAYFASNIRDLYLRFYLLPKGEIAILSPHIVIAVIVPSLLVLGLTTLRLYTLLKPKPQLLINPELVKQKPSKTTKLTTFIKKINLLTRLQIALLLRQWVKILVYSLGIILGVYLVFMALSMRDIFNKTMISYYQDHSYESIIYCEPQTCTPNDFEQAIELQIQADSYRATLVAIDEDATLHGLYNSEGKTITNLVSEGIVISQSFQDLSDMRIGDMLTIEVMGNTLDVKISAVADTYPGAYIFYDRALISEELAGNDSYFNRLYTETEVDKDNYPLVVYKSEVIEQLQTLNETYSVIIYMMVAASFAMAFIIIYLLTILTVESQYYALSLLKVIGFNKKEISKVLLGGYYKLNVILFIISIPIVMASFHIIRSLMITMYNMYFPIYVTWLDTGIAAFVLITVTFTASIHAKHKIKRHSLQEALKIYQV
ncbi:MAG: FtsX-like permease family protein, partial [Bacillota bacterium]